MWDEYKQENFNLRALLFITINDWPTLSNLSGHSNKGYKACTHCLDDTDNIWLTHYKKVVYMGHHRFLPIKHAVQKNPSEFSKTSSEMARFVNYIHDNFCKSISNFYHRLPI